MIPITEFARSRNGDDWTPALNYAALNHNCIFIPSGNYLFKAPPNPFQADVRLITEGSLAANDSAGVLLIADYDGGDFLCWNGGDKTTAGGGMDRIKVSKGKGKKGGSLIKLLAQDNDHRAGSWIGSYIAMHTSDYGRPDYGFDLDGSKCQDKGNSGVRDVQINGGRFAGCLKANMRIRWATTFQAQQLVTMENKQPDGNKIEVEDSFYVILNGSMRSTINFRRTVESAVSGSVYQVNKDEKSSVEVSAYQTKPMGKAA